jgi:hypothetical protein
MDVALAADLANLGRRSGSAGVLIEAARILIADDVQDLRPANTGGQANQKGGDEAREPFTATALLAEARRLAGVDSVLLSQIDTLASQRPKGRPSGESIMASSRRLYPHGSDPYGPFTFVAGEVARVTVRGGDGELSLYVFDDKGNKVCAKALRGERDACEWHPLWTARYTVKVSNNGDHYEPYTLITN